MPFDSDGSVGMNLVDAKWSNETFLEFIRFKYSHEDVLSGLIRLA